MEMRLALHILALLIGVPIIFGSGSSNADTLFGQSGDNFTFASNDMSLVEVYFTDGEPYSDDGVTKLGAWNPKLKAFEPAKSTYKFSLPRAYVNTCFPYRTRHEFPEYEVDKIPDKAFCQGGFHTYFLYPSGLPLSMIDRKFRKSLEDGSTPSTPYFGKGYDQLTNVDYKLRYLEMSAEIGGGSRNDRYLDLEYHSTGDAAQYVKYIGKYEGFTEVRLSDDADFFDTGPDEIRLVRCTDLIEKSLPQRWCTAYFPVNDNLRVALATIDFRLHGGREFLRERVRNFKKIMCPYLKCDEKALRAAEVTGELQ